MNSTGRLLKSLILTVAFAGALSACREPIDFTLRNSTRTNIATTYTWYGPNAMDLGGLRDSSLDSFFDSLEIFPTSDHTAEVVGDLVTDISQSFADFRLSANSSQAVMVSTLFDGNRFRPLGRGYFPRSQGGGGWTPFGPQSSFLSPLSSAVDFTNVAAAVNRSGSVLSVFSDDGTLGGTPRSAGLSGTSTWGSFSAMGTTGPTGTHDTNGFVTGVAWDDSGHAFYAYADATVDSDAVATNTGQILRYTAGSGWDAFTDSTRLGPGVSQLKTETDGLGVTPLWVSDDILYSTQIWLGGSVSCVTGTQGTKCWGENSQGAVGTTGTIGTDVDYPTNIVMVNSSNVSQISGSNTHTCAVNSGTAFCWGNNSDGQIGTGSTQPNIPLPAPISLSNVISVAAGSLHTCAIVTTSATVNTVYCWGDNVNTDATNSRLGDPDILIAALTGLTAPSTTYPVEFAALAAGEKPVKVVAGADHTCVLTNQDRVHCWGRGDSGQIGDNGNVSRDTARLVTLVAGTSAEDIAIGPNGNTTCIVASTTATGVVSGVQCWGDNSSGQIGAGGVTSIIATAVPLAVADQPNVTSVAPGLSHTCILLNTGVVQCLGDNTVGQIGTGATGGASTPLTTISTPANITAQALASGANHSCILSHSGAMFCWHRADQAALAPTTPPP